MIQNQPAEFIRKPKTLALAKRIPRQSVDAFKLDLLLLAYAQAGNLSCELTQVIHYLPNLNDSKKRNEVIKELSSLVFAFKNIQIKPYKYVRYSEAQGTFTWEYTCQYIDYYVDACILLPEPHDDWDRPFCPPEVTI